MADFPTSGPISISSIREFMNGRDGVSIDANNVSVDNLFSTASNNQIVLTNGDFVKPHSLSEFLGSNYTNNTPPVIDLLGPLGFWISDSSEIPVDTPAPGTIYKLNGYEQWEDAHDTTSTGPNEVSPYLFADPITTSTTELATDHYLHFVDDTSIRYIIVAYVSGYIRFASHPGSYFANSQGFVVNITIGSCNWNSILSVTNETELSGQYQPAAGHMKFFWHCTPQDNVTWSIFKDAQGNNITIQDDTSLTETSTALVKSPYYSKDVGPSYIY